MTTIDNRFIKGLNLDEKPSQFNNESYRFARNATFYSRQHRSRGLYNEASNEKVLDESNIAGFKYCEVKNTTYYITLDEEIYSFNHETREKEFIMSSGEFGCSWGIKSCEWLGDIEYKLLGTCQELHMYFSIDYIYYVVNIDLMLNEARKAGLQKELACETKCGLNHNCDYFKLVKTGCSPKIVAIPHSDGGGSLKAGSYHFAIRMLNRDGGETNLSHFSNNVKVGSEHNVAGEQTSAYIELSLTGLDCKFSKMEIIVVEEVGGIITARIINTLHYNTDRYTYRYFGNEGEPISLKEILVNSTTEPMGKYMTQKDGYMLYYGIKPEKNVNYQYRVNAFQTEWVALQVPYAQVKKYNLKSFMGGETYAFGAMLNYEDGTHSDVFNIPATPVSGGAGGTGTGTSLNLIAEYEDTLVSLDITYTATINQGGDDDLNIFISGDNTLTDFVEKIAESDGNNVKIFLTDHDGTPINFDLKYIDFSNANSVFCKGKVNVTKTGSCAFGQAIKYDLSGQDGSTLLNAPSGGGQTSSVCSNATITIPELVERTRGAILTLQTSDVDSVSNPQNDHFDEHVDDTINNIGTVVIDVCREIKLREDALRAQCCNCYGDDCGEVVGECANVCCGTGDQCPEGSAYERCVADIADVENGYIKWQDLLSSYIEDDINPVYNSSSIKAAANKLLDSIKNRERIERKRLVYSISKTSSYLSAKASLAKSVELKMQAPFFDVEGKPLTEIDFQIIGSGRTEPKFETDIRYPCNTDCNGNFMYGALAGTNVAHHKFPDSSEVPHFVSKSIGVPYGTFFPDASETDDLYINLKAVRFSNITLPDDSELPKPLCKNNPVTICMVPRTEGNRSVLLKGLATGTFTIDNNGKAYDHPRHGVNGLTEVSFYHDDGDGGRLSNGGSGSSHTVYSLDGDILKPSLPGTDLKAELTLSGQGERYGLMAKGTAPEDALKGSRRDALGARQSVNLSSSEAVGSDFTRSFTIYADYNESVSPPSGGGSALMNRSGQSCIWVGSGLPQVTDDSFTGDVLQHNVPIPDAEGHYVSFLNDIPNQYGNLENLNYTPIIHLGKDFDGTAMGAVGDIYIGPYSFIKTGFVSDKVGSIDDKFNIPAQVTTKTEKRCVCDSPEDVVHSMVGNWVWTELPEDGDPADPKNWAGTHTIVASRTYPYDEAVGTPAISDFYWPGTVTTNITYIGEFEVCPWLREISDRLENQFYTELKSDFRFDAGVSRDSETHGWEDAYLSIYHRRIEQPSLWKKVVKTLIRTLLNVIFPMLGVDNFFDFSGGTIEVVGNIMELPYLLVMWYLMVQVLFRNEFLDKLLGIPVCKSDDTNGFSEGDNTSIPLNYNRYNLDYSSINLLKMFTGIPDNYNVCDCGDKTTNEIYISDRQVQGSDFDAYKHIRPLSKRHIPANHGELTNIEVVSGVLYAHTTDALIRLKHQRVLMGSNDGDIIIGSSDFLQEPESATEGIVEGFAGLRYHNAAINTQYGYFWVDSDGDVIYRYSQKLEQISNNGAFNFMKNHLPFCNKSDCVDAKSSSYYSLGVDPRNNRLLVTKEDGNSSWSLSYDLVSQVWVSFHDYIPKAYLWDRKDMYSLDGDGFWLHNHSDSVLNFYGTKYPFEVEVVASGQATFKWNNVLINLEAETPSGDVYINDVDDFFTEIAFYNSTQGTGLLPTLLLSDDSGKSENSKLRNTDLADQIKVHKNARYYYINDFKDLRKKDCSHLPLIVKDKCEPYHKINEGIFDCKVINEQNYFNKVILDKYVIYRFKYSGTNKLNLITLHTFTEKIVL